MIAFVPFPLGHMPILHNALVMNQWLARHGTVKVKKQVPVQVEMDTGGQ